MSLWRASICHLDFLSYPSPFFFLYTITRICTSELCIDWGSWRQYAGTHSLWLNPLSVSLTSIANWAENWNAGSFHAVRLCSCVVLTNSLLSLAWVFYLLKSTLIKEFKFHVQTLDSFPLLFESIQGQDNRLDTVFLPHFMASSAKAPRHTALLH